MALDFQSLHEQVTRMGENATFREQRLQDLRVKAKNLLKGNAREIDQMRRKVQAAVHNYDSTLRCALPVSEPLDTRIPLPTASPETTVLAADGSQINPDRHAQVNYCLINVGAISMRQGSPDAPKATSRSTLYYEDELYTASGGWITEEMVELRRDINERQLLAELAREATLPVVAFTDGPMELWGAKDAGDHEYQQSLTTYKSILSQLCALGVVMAGYVDKPSADLAVRLLEVVSAPDNELKDIRKLHPLRGVHDGDLYYDILTSPGDRSAVFAMQSKSASNYPGELALHFFYLNVGRPGKPWLARVEIPAWVAQNPLMLDNLHAALISQCQIMGSRPYPYILHRSHEAAVVTLPEKEEVTLMIVNELRRRGVTVGDQSYKQGLKDISGRTRYEG